MEPGRKPIFDTVDEPVKFQIRLPYRVVEVLKINAIRARLPVSEYIHTLLVEALGLPPGHPAAVPPDTDGVVLYERMQAAIAEKKTTGTAISNHLGFVRSNLRHWDKDKTVPEKYRAQLLTYLSKLYTGGL